jgi:hypothetical protein
LKRIRLQGAHIDIEGQLSRFLSEMRESSEPCREGLCSYYFMFDKLLMFVIQYVHKSCYVQ